MNKVILIGRLGRDPEVRYSQSGFCFANVSLATTEKRKNNQTQQYDEHTEWHRLVFLGRTAENVSEYLSRGSQIAIEGKIQTRNWTDKSGQDRYMTEIVVDKVTFLDKRSDRQTQQEQPQTQQEQPNNQDDIPF